MELSLIAVTFVASIALGVAASYATLSVTFLAMQRSGIDAVESPGSETRSTAHSIPTAWQLFPSLRNPAPAAAFSSRPDLADAVLHTGRGFSGSAWPHLD